MFCILRICVFLVVLSINSVLTTTANDIKEDGDRGAHSDRGGLWFGPRLGKRSLKIPDEDKRDLYYKLLEASDALKYYYDQLPGSYFERRNDPDTKVTKKVIFTPKLGRSLEENERQFADFTPRLGRRIVEEFTVTPADSHDMYRGDGDRIASRNRYFSPRLGRTMNFSPRLGREINYDTYADKIRLVRSINDNKDKH